MLVRYALLVFSSVVFAAVPLNDCRRLVNSLSVENVISNKEREYRHLKDGKGQPYFLKTYKDGNSYNVISTIDAHNALPDHPNIVGLKCHYRESGAMHLLFESGTNLKNLREYLEDEPNRKKWKPQLKHFAYQLKELLEFLHGYNVYHNDIKPDNIMIDTNTFKIHLIDFDIAHVKGKPMNFVGGTQGYYVPVMAPIMARVLDIYHAYEFVQTNKQDINAYGATLAALANIPVDGTFNWIPFTYSYQREGQNLLYWQDLDVEIKNPKWHEYVLFLSRQFVSSNPTMDHKFWGGYNPNSTPNADSYNTDNSSFNFQNNQNDASKNAWALWVVAACLLVNFF